MSLFEIVTITLSVILGLSMSHMLWSTIASIRARNEFQLHWLPFTWAASIFMQHAYFWFAVYSVDLFVDAWTWTWYLQMLLIAFLLFAAGALILPSQAQRTDDLLQDYHKHGRLALIPLGGHQLVWFPTNFRANEDLIFPTDLWIPANMVNFVLIALVVIGYCAQRTIVHAIAAILFLTVLLWAQSTVWAPNVF